MMKRFLVLLGALFLAVSARAGVGGYTLHRLVIWAEPGEGNPRFQQDPDSGRFALLFPGPVPETGWEPVEARRLMVHGGAFLAADPVPILRARDPDPDWDTVSTEASLDLNQDRKAEIVRARTVMIPDSRDPSAGVQRVLVEIREEDRILFGDLLEGPSGGPVRIHSVSTSDFTGEGYPDLVIRLEAEGRSGIAFYSQAPLRTAGAATRTIPGFSPTAFHSDRYGIFDLGRLPRDFFAHLPSAARPEEPECGAGRRSVGADGRGRCRYLFTSPYLGWIREFRVEFVPDRQIDSFELVFPSGQASFTPEQALEFLTPVLGGGFTTQERMEGEEKRLLWNWKGKGANSQLLGVESGGKTRAVRLRIERS